jgi:DNA polymerase III epsilon subunit-like protein
MKGGVMYNPLFLDVETTGTDEEKHRIVQLYAKFPVSGKDINLFIKPCEDDESFYLSPGALKITGIDMLDLCTNGLGQREAMIMLTRFVMENNAGQRVKVVGHNSDFDFRFVMATYKRLSMEFKNTFYFNWLCTQKWATILQHEGLIRTYSMKLTSLCEEFGIETSGAHDAAADINMTIALYNKLKEFSPMMNAMPTQSSF